MLDTWYLDTYICKYMKKKSMGLLMDENVARGTKDQDYHVRN